jgi:hypothetical protein
MEERQSMAGSKIIFTFQVDRADKGCLTAIRLNIMELLKLLDGAPDSVTISCRTVITSNTPRLLHESQIDVRTLRLSAFIALSHLLEAKPWRRNQTCPAVYIDGYGNAVEIVNPGRKLKKHTHRVPQTSELMQSSDAKLRVALQYAREFRLSLDYWHPQKWRAQKKFQVIQDISRI